MGLINGVLLAASDASPSEELWAEHGLTGLVLFALIGIIILFIRFNQERAKEDKAFIEKILCENMSERKEIREDNAKNIAKLATALDGLTDRLRGIEYFEVHNKDKAG